MPDLLKLTLTLHREGKEPMPVGEMEIESQPTGQEDVGAYAYVATEQRGGLLRQAFSGKQLNWKKGKPLWSLVAAILERAELCRDKV
jgi:hypothetical protein